MTSLNPTAQECFIKITTATTKEEIIALVDEYASEKKDLSYSTFKNWMTPLNNLVKTIENVPQELKAKYQDRDNHIALTHSLTLVKTRKDEEEAKKKSTKTEAIREEVSTKQPAKVADVLDADRFIKLAESLIHSDDWRDMGIGLSMLTGLRQADCFFYTKIEAENEYSIIVSNISKKRGDKQDYSYRIPTFYNSDSIEQAYEKLRTIKPFHELNLIASEEGLVAARDKFNTLYSTTIASRFNTVCKDFLPSDDNKFHSLRGCFASIWYSLIIARKVSPKDAIEFATASLAHDTEGISQRYLKNIFENLPVLPEQVFETEYTEVTKDVLPDKIICFNLNRVLNKLSLEAQADLMLAMQNESNIDNAIAERFERAFLQKKMMTANSGRLEPSPAQKLANLVRAAIKYNDVKNTPKLCITTTSLQRLGREILMKEPDRNTTKDVIQSLQIDIDDCHKSHDITEKTNLSLRGGDKMASIVENIKTIYATL